MLTRFTILTVAIILGVIFFWRERLDNRNGQKGLHPARIMTPLQESRYAGGVGRWGSSGKGGGGGGEEAFTGRAAIGCDYSYDAQKFYLGLALDPKYIDRGFVEGCLERVGEDEPEKEESFLRAEWEEWASSWSCGSQGWRSEWSIPEVSDPQGVSRE